MEEKMEIGTNSTAYSPASPAPVEIETLKKEISFVLTTRNPQNSGISLRSRLNEEDLYAAALTLKLSEIQPDTATSFRNMFQEQFELIRKKQKKTLVFAAADRVMRAFVRSGEISREVYRATRDFAFGKAQLDSDRTWLSREKVPGTKEGDTPVRAVSTALARYSANSAADTLEIKAWRMRTGEMSLEKFRAAKSLRTTM